MDLYWTQMASKDALCARVASSSVRTVIRDFVRWSLANCFLRPHETLPHSITVSRYLPLLRTLLQLWVHYHLESNLLVPFPLQKQQSLKRLKKELCTVSIKYKSLKYNCKLNCCDSFDTF